MASNVRRDSHLIAVSSECRAVLADAACTGSTHNLAQATIPDSANASTTQAVTGQRHVAAAAGKSDQIQSVPATPA